MKTIVVLAVSLLGFLTTVQGQNTNNETVSSNDAVTLGMDMLLELENGMLLSFSTHYIAMSPNPKVLFVAARAARAKRKYYFYLLLAQRPMLAFGC